MATKDNELELHDPDFMAAFGEGEDAGGMDLQAAEEAEEGAADSAAEEAAETAAGPEGAPAVVVVVAEADAAAVTPSAEAPVVPTEGEEEAATQSAKSGAKPADGSAAHEGAETPAAEKTEQASGDDDLSDVPAEDLQKAKSWMGRLKAREAELAKREAEVAKGKGTIAKNGNQAAGEAGASLEQAAEQAAAAGDKEQAAAAADLAQQVRDGEISEEDAAKILAEDFGDEFINQVQRVSGAAAKKQLQPVQEELANTKAQLEALRNQAMQDHFEQIFDAHPDFAQVYEDPAFRKWAHDNGKDAVVDNGSARAINKMLDQYKKEAKPAAAPAQETAKPAPAKVDPAALEAAEGVRSTGGAVRVPEKPGRATDDYAAAWEKF